MSETLDMKKLHSEEINNISVQLNALHTETVNLKTRCSRSESENILLSHENKLLKARIKQLETTQQTSQQIIQKTNTANEAAELDSEKESDEYEMEQIVGHKKKKDGLHLRWKNFTKKDDTWERESILMCSLCKYKQKKNLK